MNQERLNRLRADQLLLHDGLWKTLPGYRKDAINLKSAWYYTGIKCKKGHLAPRRTSNSSCLLCEASPERRRGIREHQVRQRESDLLLSGPKTKEAKNNRKTPEEKLLDIAEKRSIPKTYVLNALNEIDTKVNQKIGEVSGLERFFIGDCCIYNHQPLRYITDRERLHHVCYKCKLIRAKIYSLENAEIISIRNALRYSLLDPEDRQKKIDDATKWNLENPQKHLESASNYATNNPERRRKSVQKQNQKPSQKAAIAEWRDDNPARVRGYSSQRREGVSQATPPWLSGKAQQDITKYYEEAKRLSVNGDEPHEVDHIMPLNPRDEKKPKGLHVPWNLRVIARSENRRLSDKLPSPREYTAPIEDRKIYISMELRLD